MHDRDLRISYRQIGRLVGKHHSAISRAVDRYAVLLPGASDGVHGLTIEDASVLLKLLQDKDVA